jgi:HK97 family phage portal protein
VLLRGNGHLRIVRDGAGDVRELWTIPPDCIRARRPAPREPLMYDVSMTGVKPEELRADQVWTIPGLSWNGLTGLSPIGLARETFGVAVALEKSTAAAMKNGARIGTLVSYPDKLQEDEYAARLQSFKEQFSGPTSTSRTFFADGGAKAERIGMSFQDLQFIDIKRFQLAEICRLFRVPRHMVFDTDSQPRANMEQSSLEFVVYTLRPWLVRFEQSIYRCLLTRAERTRYFAEHNVGGLLRGDFQSRMEGYLKARTGGWLSVNDILRLENRNGIGPGGDDYRAPLNSSPKSDVPADGAAAAAQEAA